MTGYNETAKAWYYVRNTILEELYKTYTKSFKPYEVSLLMSFSIYQGRASVYFLLLTNLGMGISKEII